MKSILYRFQTLNKNTCFLYQFIHDRKLTDIYHSHDFFEIVILISGNFNHYINGKKYFSKEGSVTILKPDDSHCFLSQSSEIITISLSVEAAEALRFLHLFNLTQSITDSKDAIVFQVDNLTQKLNFNTQETSADLPEYQLKYLLCTVLKLYLDHLNQKSELPGELLNAIHQMRQPQNLQTGIPAFTALSGYSRSHLKRLIRRYYDVTLQEFVMNMRLQSAYNSIILSRETLEDIAYSVGYSSFSHFNKIFKAKYGISPALLRKSKKLWTI